MSRSTSTLFIRAAKAARSAVIGRYSRARLSFATSDVDFLLVSYPKSGRTWFRYILSCYFAESLGFSTAPDLSTMFRFLPNLDWDNKRGLPAYKRHSGELAVKFPLVAVTHQHPGIGLATVPVIYLLRDPRDVLVSRYYHATRHKHQFSGEISEFIKDPSQGLPAWVRHTNGWVASLVNRLGAVISYESLGESPFCETSHILKFLGVDVEPERLSRAIAAADIDRMRKLEIRNAIPGHQYDRQDPQALRVRRGIVGGYREELKRHDLDWIDEYNEVHLNSDARWLVGHMLSPQRHGDTLAPKMVRID